jgi:hypothetical protein
MALFGFYHIIGDAIVLARLALMNEIHDTLHDDAIRLLFSLIPIIFTYITLEIFVKGLSVQLKATL